MRKAFALLILALLFCAPAMAALTVSQPPSRREGTLYYTLATVTGSLTGTTPAEVTIKLPAPTVSGSVLVLVTGDVETAMVVAKLRDSRFQDGEADLLSAVSTATTLGRAGFVVELFQNVPKDSRMSMPAGTYTFRMVSSNAGSTGGVTATLLFVHAP